VREEGKNQRLVWTGGLGIQAFLNCKIRHDAQHLLERQGCEILCRFGHIHATRDVQEWHVCLVADLASMPPSHLLARLDKALKLRVEQSIALSPLTHEEGAKVRRDKQEKSIKKEAL
jgi:hypothetical protein